MNTGKATGSQGSLLNIYTYIRNEWIFKRRKKRFAHTNQIFWNFALNFSFIAVSTESCENVKNRRDDVSFCRVNKSSHDEVKANTYGDNEPGTVNWRHEKIWCDFISKLAAPGEKPSKNKHHECVFRFVLKQKTAQIRFDVYRSRRI